MESKEKETNSDKEEKLLQLIRELKFGEIRMNNTFNPWKYVDDFRPNQFAEKSSELQ